MDAIVIFRDFSANATQQLGVTLLKRSFGGKVPGTQHFVYDPDDHGNEIAI